MKPIREQLHQGKLYCLTHKGARVQNVRSGALFPPGIPMLFLGYRGSNGITADSFKFLIGEKVEEITFRVERHLLLKKLDSYIIPLHEWEEYITFYNEYYKEVGAPEHLDIQIQVQTIKSTFKKLPSNLIVEVLPDIQAVHTIDAEKEFIKHYSEEMMREIALQKQK